MAGRTSEAADAGLGTMSHGCDRHSEPSRRCYCVCGCRCPECREEQRAYAARYSRDQAYGRVRRVPADEVRRHVERMRQAGVGWKRLADEAGVGRSTLWKIIEGRSKTVNRATYDRLMNVRAQRADGAYIPGTQYVRALEQLHRRGWKKRDLGVWVTGDPNTRSLQVNGPNIKVGTAKRIVELVNLIEADRVRCVGCGVHVRKQTLCGGCRVRRHVKA